MQTVDAHFTGLDWTVLIGYLLLTTWIGHALRGKQATMKDFFLAGRSLPWPVVCASIIATEISALTFIGVPGMVFAANGDFTYLQWALGSIIARCIVGMYFVKVFYEREIFSPYDYMAHKLGPGVKFLTTAMFTIGSLLGQSVRVLVTALILKTVTPLDMLPCIAIIIAFSIAWTLIGGMTTVIWTDAIQFCLFVFSGFLAFGLLLYHIDGSWAGYIETASAGGKFTLLNFSTDPDVQFTMWVALIAMPFQNLAAFGTDQLNAQRMFCCRNESDARKAIIVSSFSQVITVLMLMVGAALWVYYRQHPPTEAEAVLFAESTDNVFPVWITTVIPPGLTGLVLAGAFAAAISSLDSALTALSQTSLALIKPASNDAQNEHPRMVVLSRIAVVIWAVILGAFAIGLFVIKQVADLDLISLAFGMVAYTYGPMLGIFLLALAGIRTHIAMLWAGLILSVLLTLWIRPDLYVLLAQVTPLEPTETLAHRPKITFAWLYPVTCLITFGCGWLGSKLFRMKY